MKNYSGSSTPNNYQYTGQQFDDEIDLYSLRARYYDPANGRFLSKDTWPINFQNPVELNRYGYTANNPVNYFDPSGLTGVKGYASTIKHVALYLATGDSKYLPAGLIYQTLAPFISGAIIGIAGYLIGIAVYNYDKGAISSDALFEGFDWIDFGEAVVSAGIIGLANHWVNWVAGKHTGPYPDQPTRQADILFGKITGFFVISYIVTFATYFISEYNTQQGYGTNPDWSWIGFIALVSANWSSMASGRWSMRIQLFATIVANTINTLSSSD